MQVQNTIPKYEENLFLERKLWNDYFSSGLLVISQKCSNCNKYIEVMEHNSSINPYLGRCTNPNCRKIIYLRQKTIFELNSKTPLTLTRYIVELSLVHLKNANEIYESFRKSEQPYNISKQHILEILLNMRKIISKYYEDIYKLEEIALENGNDYLSIDESLFVHTGDISKCVVGIINNRSREIRLEIVDNRTTETMKNIINRYIPRGNIIVTDDFSSYRWLDDPSSGYVHSVHNHGHGNFGSGLDSTSHIEALWSNLKSLIKTVYTVIPKENFSLFLREAEFRRNFKKFNNNNIMKEYDEIAKYVNDVYGGKIN